MMHQGKKPKELRSQENPQGDLTFPAREAARDATLDQRVIAWWEMERVDRRGG